MLSTLFARTAPCLAVLLALSSGCLPDEDHTVGSDDAGDGDDGSTDSGARCSNVPECEGIDVPARCTTGSACVNGVNQCEIVCSDAGSIDAGSTSRDSSAPCSNVPECVGVSIPVGCSVGQSVCVDGVNECGEPVCPDGGAADAGGGSFACGAAGLTCDPTTQFCVISLAGLPPVDGGASSFPSCQTIPTACAGNLAGAAATCACLQEHTGGTCEVSNGGDLTVTIANP